MKYSRFEELPVWKDAIELAVRIFALTAKPYFRGHSGLSAVNSRTRLFQSRIIPQKDLSAEQLKSC
jgi:hypothetical protein